MELSGIKRWLLWCYRVLVTVAKKKQQKKKKRKTKKKTDGSGCSQVQGLGFGFRISVRVGLWLSRLTGLGGGMGKWVVKMYLEGSLAT